MSEHIENEVVEPEETPQEPQETDETQEPAEEPTDPPEGTEEPEAFPRDYVEKLRKENAKYRERAGRANELASALWTARVQATGRLADPSDCPMPDDVDPLDPDSVTTAVDDLLARKPHLASRKVHGNVGQGAVSDRVATVDLAGLLRSRAS